MNNTEKIINDTWPLWEPVECLGRGSFGSVYKAVRRDNKIEVTSAIKVIPIPQDKSEYKALRSEGMTEAETSTYFRGIVDGFVNEIITMESFRGMQNIVSIEDYQVVENPETDGWVILMRMELLTPFDDYVQQHEMTEEDVVQLGIDICTALEICAKRSIIHRDIKPENIFINNFGYFKLGDFGIAKKLENLNASNSQKGTFNYMAPEVANGTHYDQRVDIYSLGIVLYRLLNNNFLPFINDSNRLSPEARKNALERRLNGEKFLAPSQASKAVADVIMKACAHKPDERFTNATEFKQALQKAERALLAPAAEINAPVKETEVAAVSLAEDLDETMAIHSKKDVTLSDGQKTASTPVENSETNIDFDETVRVFHNENKCPQELDAQEVAQEKVASPYRQNTNYEQQRSNPPYQNNAPVQQYDDRSRQKGGKRIALIVGAIVASLAVLVLLLIVFSGKTISPQSEHSEPKNTVHTETTRAPIPTQGSEKETASTTVAPTTQHVDKYSIGEVIRFGTLDWIVLDKKGDKYFILSQNIISFMPYNDVQIDITWEISSIRRYLNGDFIKQYIPSEPEQRKIQLTNVVNENNPYHGTYGGPNTQDYVFLLSIQEVDQYFSTDASKIALMNGRPRYWWLRSPGHYSSGAAYVHDDGFSKGSAYNCTVSEGIRPAMWISE